MSNPKAKEANFRIVRYNGEYRVEVLDKPIGWWYIVKSKIKTLWQAVEHCQEFLRDYEHEDVLPGLGDEHSIAGRDYVPVNWVETLQEYGVWKIVRTDEKTEPTSEDTKAFQEGVKEGRRLERQEFDSELGEAYNQGREDVLKELPRWKPLKNGHLFKDGMQNVCFEGGGVATCLIYGDKYILISDLEKLPKEE